MSLDEKITKARVFSNILKHEKYQSPHTKFLDAKYLIEKSNYYPSGPQSIQNSPSLPKIEGKRNLKSSSPSKIKLMNRYKEKNTNKPSIFFPKISNDHTIEKVVEPNEFLDEKSSFVKENPSFFKKGKQLERFEEKIFTKFPKDFFPLNKN